MEFWKHNRRNLEVPQTAVTKKEWDLGFRRGYQG